MAELVDAADLKSAGSNTVRVQVPLCPPDLLTKYNHDKGPIKDI